MSALPPDLRRMLETMRAIEREAVMESFRLDSAVVQEGRAIERERRGAFSGYEHYEGGRDGNE
jgi:hypothetical protein